MSNYAANARTNSFVVDSIDALISSLDQYGLTVSEVPYDADLLIAPGDVRADGAQAVKLFSYGGWPDMEEESVAERIADDCIAAPSKPLHHVVAEHLADDAQVAIFIEIGQEQMRYLAGVAVAINKAGETRRVDLDDIVDLARELAPAGTTVDHASY